MNKLIPLLAFSILLLVPVGVQNAYSHLLIDINEGFALSCFGGAVSIQPNENNIALAQTLVAGNGGGPLIMEIKDQNNVVVGIINFNAIGGGGNAILNTAILATPIPVTPGDTYTVEITQCPFGIASATQNFITYYEDVSPHCGQGTILSGLECIAQSMGSMIGGALGNINTVSLLVGAIGTNPIITALMGITIAGVVGQTAWFVHRRKNNNS